MNLLIKRGQAGKGPKRGPAGSSVLLGRIFVPAALCVALTVNYTAAAQRTGDDAGKPKTVVAKPKGGPPRWVCPETNVTVPPIWRGQQIACPFIIRNEGAGALDIKAKGG